MIAHSYTLLKIFIFPSGNIRRQHVRDVERRKGNISLEAGPDALCYADDGWLMFYKCLTEFPSVFLSVF